MPLSSAFAGLGSATGAPAAQGFLPPDAVRPLFEGLQALPPLGAAGPRLGDVVFSTRWPRDDSIEMLKAFGATRCEWVYSSDPNFVRSVHETGATFGGTINANVKTPGDIGAARDYDGKPLIAPWMTWGAKWVTTTHPATRDALWNVVKQTLDAGADVIQVDDPALQAATVGWGGDFAETTLAGFGPYLQTHVPSEQLARWEIASLEGFDYRDYLASHHGIQAAEEYKKRLRELPTTAIWQAYLKNTVRTHYASLRTLLNTYREQPVPLSMNIYDPQPEAARLSLAAVADYVMAENPSADFARDALRCATVRALGLRYVASLDPRSVNETRAKIAGFYARGAAPLVPWDVYVGADADGTVRRYFGRPEDYADLYQFVRTHPELFDGWETAPIVGIPIPVDRYRDRETHALVQRLTSAQVPFAFALTGGKEPRFRLDPERMRHFQTIALVNPVSDFTPADQALLAGLPALPAQARDLTDEHLESLAPVVLQDAKGVYVQLRVPVDGRSDSLLIHLVNTNPRAADRATPITVALLLRTPEGATVRSATWYEPGASSPRSLTPEHTAGGTSLRVPTLREWGVLKLEFAE